MLGSLDNMIAGSSELTPKVGMGATQCMWTDRHAFTIVEVSPSGKTIVVQEDHATRTDNNGMCDLQSYSYSPNPDAPRIIVRKCKRGWKSKNDKFVIGYRDAHHDYGF